jgi:hypothetical protein
VQGNHTVLQGKHTVSARIASVAAKTLNMPNLMTVISLSILVGTEVFGVALASGWAIAGLFELGATVSYVLMAIFSAAGIWAMTGFVRGALKAEPART